MRLPIKNCHVNLKIKENFKGYAAHAMRRIFFPLFLLFSFKRKESYLCTLNACIYLFDQGLGAAI